jgi:hypothetical protein
MVDTSQSSGSLFFIKDLALYDTEKPYQYGGPLEPSQEHLRTNIKVETVQRVPVHDLRQLSLTKFTLTQNSFQIMNQPSRYADRLKTEDVLQQYLEETTNLLKELLRAELVVCYNFKVRGIAQEI